MKKIKIKIKFIQIHSNLVNKWIRHCTYLLFIVFFEVSQRVENIFIYYNLLYE